MAKLKTLHKITQNILVNCGHQTITKNMANKAPKTVKYDKALDADNTITQ